MYKKSSDFVISCNCDNLNNIMLSYNICYNRNDSRSSLVGRAADS